MLSSINRIVGTATPIAVLVAGVYFACRMRGLPFSRPRVCAKALFHAGGGDRSPLKSMTLALAGTLGVGNIVGVSSAIALGGFGAIFWMWVSAFAAMFLKYAEVVLAMKHREKSEGGHYRGGAPYYIRHFVSRFAPPKIAALAAVFFAVLCIVNAVLMGCVIQSSAVATATREAFGFSPLFCGVFLGISCFAVLTRGKHAITAFTSVLVPLMSILFLLLSLAVLFLRRGEIPSALGLIFRNAFATDSAVGGVMGFLLSRGLRFGTIRGIISNEAGCGTSPTAHAASNAKSAVEQGLFGIVEVFVDTILLCTVAALVIIAEYDGVSHLAADPMAMTMAAYAAPFGTMGGFVRTLLSCAIGCFGFATMLCWAHYGTESLDFILRAMRKKKESTSLSRTSSLFFIGLFCAFAYLGAVSAPALIWSLTDLVTGTMTLCNVSVLLGSRREILIATQSYFGVVSRTYSPLTKRSTSAQTMSSHHQ